MSVVAALALAMQVSVSIGTEKSGVRVGEDDDTTTRRTPVRIAVTDEMRRTAFRDPGARDLLLRARVARMLNDSMLISYSAKTYSRISVGMSLRETARSRLAFRTETAALVSWHRDAGVHVEMLGARSAVPIAREAQKELNDESPEVMSIPYFPGKEQLWIGGSRARAEIDEGEIIHPIAVGSEAYYHYATGDSVLMTLPDGKRITLRELRITAREPRWNAVVGSFWFETERANLVRAVYRLSSQMDIWAVAQSDDSTSMDDVPFFVRPLLTPMLADITAISVEYGLYEQRFWLPKLHGMDGYARVSFMRVPLRVEERYRYESVNGLDSLPIVPMPTSQSTRPYRDSLIAAGMDSGEVRVEMRRYREERDSIAWLARESECLVGGTYTEHRWRYDRTLAMAVQIPCDYEKLRTSAELPKSIFDEGEELFGTREREDLMKALSMSLQPGWAPQLPTVEWGLAHTRFNRVEGFATGAVAKLNLGKGYTTSLGARASVADLQFNGELALARSNGRSELRGALYRRLAVSSDFGDPLSFGASLPAILYARDEGFYHRAWGAEIGGSRPMRGGLDWRLFAEQQWSAAVENRWSLFGGANDTRFIGNVAAEQGWLYGSTLRWRGSRGLDPRGWRAAVDVRLEGAVGDFEYGRAFLETTVSHGLGPVDLSLTGAGGTSVGELPSQRHFFLGGLQSVRGQTAGSGFGDAFWLARTEVGLNRTGVRPVVFADLGWAGSRGGWDQVGRPMSGAGIGTSFLDGMIRIDLSRGIHPRVQTRLDLYLEARF